MNGKYTTVFTDEHFSQVHACADQSRELSFLPKPTLLDPYAFPLNTAKDCSDNDSRPSPPRPHDS